MQRTKLETHTNINRKPNMQNALTEPIADEANFLNQKVLEHLEVFNQNRLGKPSYPLNRRPTRPSGDMGGIVHEFAS